MSISVIIPFYNETIFLAQAVRSALGLADRLHQIVIVDDSPGRYPQALERVRSLDSRIEVVTNAQNIGASASRNAGLERATGAQVLFLDSDDVIASDAVAQARDLMVREKADLAHIPTMVMAQRTSTLFRFPRDDRLFGKAATGLSCQTFPDIRYALANWSFLFDADYLARNKIAFDPSQRMFEDHLFILNAVENAENFVLLGAWGHLWRKRGGSLTTTNYSAADMASQVASIRKCLGFLAARHGPSSPVVQRDVAFCLSRYLMTWPSLFWALSNAHSEDAAALLNDISDAFAPYALTEETCASRAMQRLFGSTLRLYSGAQWPTVRLHEMFKTLIANDWAKLADQLAVSDASPSASGRSPNEPDKRGTDIEAALNQFHTGANDAASKDLRLFSEIIFDEIDEWVRPPNSSITLRDNAIADLNSIAHLAARFSSDLARVQNRRMLRSGSPTGRGGNAPPPKAIDAFTAACDLTNRYLSGECSQDAENALNKPALAHVWRCVEDAFSPLGSLESDTAIGALANRAVYGDADIWGRRKIRTRARLLLRNVVPALRP